MKKRIIAMVLSVAMMLTMFPTGVLADDFVNDKENTAGVTVSAEGQSNDDQGEERDIAQVNVDEDEETQPETVLPENEQTEPEQAENDQTEPTQNETDQAKPDQTVQPEPGSTVPDQAGTTPDDKQPEPEQPATDPAENGVSDGAENTEGEQAESKTEFTVTWKNGETVLAEAKFAEGTSAEEVENAQPAETPVQEADDEFVYIFSGWDHPYEAVTADQTYEAKFTKAKKFTVTWVSEGETILTKTFAEGTSKDEVEDAQPAEAPVKEADGDVEYTFAGWTPDYADVTADQTYTAKFEEAEQDEMVNTASLVEPAADIHPVAVGKTIDLTGAFSSWNKWESSDTSIATVEKDYYFGWKAKVTGIKAGFATITHTYGRGDTETFTVKVVAADIASNEQWAQVYYLKDPDKFVTLNDASNFGDLYDVVKVDTTNMLWDSGGKNYSGDDIETRVIDWRPYGYAVVPEGEHWDAIFNNFKASKEKELGVTIEKDDVTQIRIVPAKISHNNGTTPDYHVDCNVEIYCKDVATVRYFLKDAGTANFNPLGAKSYVINGESTTHPTDLDGVTTTSFPTFKTVGEVQYKFVGWEKKTGSEVTHVDFGETRQPVTGNADYYAEYTAPHTVTYQPNGGNWSGSTNPVVYNSLYKGDTHTVQQAEPTRDGYTFTGWKLEGTDTIYTLNGTIKMPDSDVVLVAQWKQSQFEVKYQYAGEVPENAPAAPGSQKATCNDQVIVKATPSLDGYTFTGWTVKEPEGLTVTDGKFTMPAKDVTFTGTWEKRTNLSYRVEYRWGDTVLYSFQSKANMTFGTTTDPVSPKEIEGYTIKPADDHAKTCTIGTSDNVIIFNYYKNVTLTANSNEKPYIYDGEAKEVTGYTASENAATFTGIPASGTGTNAGTYEVTFDDADKLVGKISTDDNYIVAKTENGTLTIAKRSVTLTSADANKVYDGTPLTKKEVTVSGEGFAKGEGATYNVTGTLTKVGEGKNTFTYTLNNGTNADNYTITKAEGTLTVTNRAEKDKYEITVKANNAKETYDGTEKSVSGFETTTFKKNINGTEVTYTVSGLSAEVKGTNAGEYTAKVTGTAKVLDAAGNDVTAQFDVKTENGKLTIDKRTVTLTSASANKVYDGTPLTKHEVTVSGDGFAKGEGATYNVTGTLTKVGEGKNTFTYTLNNGTNADNYTITKAEGTLTVTNRAEKDKYEITVKANNAKETYDGTEKSVSGFETTTFKKNINGTEVTYTVSGLSAEVKGTNAGEYTAKVTGTAKVLDAAGNDVTAQFIVNTENGKLTITPVEDEVVVRIIGNTKTVPYNREKHTVTGYEMVGTNDTLYTKDDFELVGSAEASGTDAGTYKMNLKPEAFKNNNQNFTNVSFEIVEDGWLKITPKNIVPGDNNKDLTATAPKDVVYSGESQQQKPEVKDGDKVLEEGKDYDLSYSEDTTNVGTVTVTVTGKGNYDGKFEVTYQITPASLKITTNSAEKTYDGAALTADGKIEGVVDRDKNDVKINITGSQTEVGESKNTYTIEWGTAKASNYEITEDLGTLKVNARSGGGSSSKPTPEDEPTPTPTPTPLPTLPTTPAPTTPTRRVTRSTATVTQPTSRPTEQITENETPKAESEPEVIEDEETPLAPMAGGAWALVNLILMLLTVLASLLLLLGYLGKKKYAKEDEYGNALHDANGNEIIDYTRNKKGFWRVASLIPAIAAVIAFALTENMRLPMVMTDRWTLLMVIIAVVQLIVAVLCKKKKESEEDENQANA